MTKLAVGWMMILAADAAAQEGWSECGPGSDTLGGISETGTASTVPAMAIDGSGNGMIAWQEYVGNSKPSIYFKRFFAYDWVPLGSSTTGVGLSPASTLCTNPAVAVGNDGFPVVAWTGKPSSGSAPNTDLEIQLKKWDGTNWIELDGSASPNGISVTALSSEFPSIAIGPSDAPYVAWREQVAADRQEIYLKKWDGLHWVEISGSASGGGVSNSTGTKDCPRVAVRKVGSGILYVAWTGKPAGTTMSQVYMRQYSPLTGWTSVGPADKVTNTGQEAQTCSLALDSNGNPGLAWDAGGTGLSDIHYLKWTGSAWADLGGSLGEGGLSDVPGSSRSPALAFDGGDLPAIAWEHSADGEAPEIRLRRWNGQEWAAVAGSIAGGGISNTPAGDGLAGHESVTPAMILRRSTGQITVAWAEYPASGAPDIYVRQWTNSAPGLYDMVQRRAGGAEIPPGGITFGDTTVVLETQVSDVDQDLVQVEVEVREQGVDFLGIPTAPPSAFGPEGLHSVTVSDLAMGTVYQWCARTRDARNVTSDWYSYTGTFWVRDNAAAAPVGEALQSDIATGSAIPPGGQVLSGGFVALSVAVSDPDPGDDAQMLVEFRPVDEAFTGTPTAQGPLVASGVVSVIEHPAGPGSYHWRYWTRDPYGAESSPVSYGGNLDGETDLEVTAFGSLGKVCASSAGPSAALAAALLILAAVTRAPSSRPR